MRRLAELWPESELDRRNSYTLAERRVSTIEVRQTVLTAEGAGLTIANWPSTFGLRPVGDRHLSRLLPSVLFASLLVSTRSARV